jgi:hypothetical protein
VYVDHATGFAGALFPYNLPVWVKDQYCFITNLLELSPTIEDWDFYGAGAVAAEYGDSDQVRDASRFASRLESNWRELVRARRGMMILTLHSAYCGLSRVTMEPVTKFLSEADAPGDAWFAGLGDITTWWNARRNVDIRMKSAAGRTVLRFTNRNPEPVRNLAIRLDQPGLIVQARGVTVSRVDRTEEDGVFSYFVFDLDKTAELEVSK